MTIDAHHLACLLAIARTGSFSRAASEMGQSQPTLSNNIALLERRLGVRVLERSKRGSTLTAHGEVLVRRAEGLHAMLADAEAEVRNLDMAISGPLRIGATPSTLPALIPTALKLLGPDLGASHIEIVEDLDHSLGPQLLAGKLDMVVGPVHEPFTETAGITETALLHDPFCLAVGKDNPLARKHSIALAECADQTWVLPRLGSTYRRHIEAMFLTQGVDWPPSAVYANSLMLIEALVVSGGCVTFVSPLQLRMPLPDFKVLRVENGSSRKIGLKVRAGTRLSPLGVQFASMLRASVQAIASEFRAIGVAMALVAE
jgi:DNA-binding transcriptional LysR family regulator